MFGSRPDAYKLFFDDEECELIRANIEAYFAKRGWRQFFRTLNADAMTSVLLNVYRELESCSDITFSSYWIRAISVALRQGGVDKEKAKKLDDELMKIIDF